MTSATKTKTTSKKSPDRVSNIEHRVMEIVQANVRIARALDRVRKDPGSGRTMATPAELRRQLRKWIGSAPTASSAGVKFYNQEDWLDRRPLFGAASLVSMTWTDAGPFDQLRGPRGKAFFDLAERLGYFAQFGTPTSLHFYPLHR